MLVAVDRGGPVPDVDVYRLNDDGIQAVLDWAEASGLLTSAPDYGTPGITDVGTTTVTVVADGRTYAHSAYALGFGDDVEATVTPKQREARAALQEFIDNALALAATQDDLLAEKPEPYVPDVVEAHLAAVDYEPDEAHAWPLAAPITGPGCLALRGEEIATLESGLPLDGSIGVVESGGKHFALGLRNVLPGERPCAGAQTGFVLPPAVWDGFAPDGDLVEPTEDEVAAAEAALGPALDASSDPRAAEIRGQLPGYVRQYVGIERDGARLVYVNAFCDSVGLDPAHQLVLVLDGGTCFWQALVDPAAASIVELTINGEA